MQPVHLIVLQHGIDGHTSDLDAIRARALDDASLHGLDIELWDSPINEGKGTHWGIQQCGDLLWSELKLKLGSMGTEQGRRVHLSLVGHSMGGLTLRLVASHLHRWRVYSG